MMSEKNNSPEKKNKVHSGMGSLAVLILSVIVAIGLWGYVMSLESPTSETVVPGVHVNVNNTDRLNETAGLSVLSESDNINVSFKLQGKKSILSNISAEDIRAYVDVASIKEPGTYDMEIACMPISGAIVVDISPKTVKIVVDSTGKITLPITVKFDNSTLPDGYSLGECNMNIDSVEVSGANADLEKIGGAVITLNTGTLTRSSTAMNEVPVLVDKNGNEFSSKYITFPKVYVNVYIPVFLTKDIKLDVDTLYGYYNEKNTKITVTPAKITVKGNAATVESMPDSFVIAKIDEKAAIDNFNVDINFGEYGDEVTLVSEEKVANVSIVHFASIKTEYLYPMQSIIVNNPHGLYYELPEELTGITLDIRVYSDRTGCINTNNIDVMIDLSSIDKDFKGEIVAPVRITFKNELQDKAYENGAYVLKVSIVEQQIDIESE